MIKYCIVAVLALSGCQKPSMIKPGHFLCITAMGQAQFDEGAPGFKPGRYYLDIDKDGNHYKVARSMCVEVREN